MTVSFALGVLSNPPIAYAEDVVYPIGFRECLQQKLAFHRAYPSYHYENEDESVTFDFVVPNHEEEAYQYCHFIYYEYSQSHQ